MCTDNMSSDFSRVKYLRDHRGSAHATSAAWAAQREAALGMYPTAVPPTLRPGRAL